MNLAQAYRLGAFASPAKENGRFFVAGGGGSHSLAYSTDGINWTGLGTSIFSSLCYDIATNGTMWVAVGNGSTNTLAYSLDGKIWVGLGKSIFSEYGRCVCWTGTRWIAGGWGTNGLAYSTDGINWTGLGTSQCGASAVEACFDIAYDGSKLIAVCGSNNYYSTNDGSTWTSIESIALGIAESIAYNASMWVAVGYHSSGIMIAHSVDGSSWSLASNTPFSDRGYSVVWTGTRWIAGGRGTNTLAYSVDGDTWTGLGTLVFSNECSELSWNGSRIIAGGSGTNALAYSDDSENWTGLGTSTLTACGGVACRPAPELIPAIA